jgi:hypothetical protein
MSAQVPISRLLGPPPPGYRVRSMNVRCQMSVTRTPKPGTSVSITWYRCPSSGSEPRNLNWGQRLPVIDFRHFGASCGHKNLQRDAVRWRETLRSSGIKSTDTGLFALNGYGTRRYEMN